MSSLIGRGGHHCPAVVDDPGAADRDRAALGEGAGVDPLAVDEGAVRGAEVDHPGPAVDDVHLGVPARDAGVVQHDVGVDGAADDRDGPVDPVRAAVDVERPGRSAASPGRRVAGLLGGRAGAAGPSRTARRVPVRRGARGRRRAGTRRAGRPGTAAAPARVPGQRRGRVRRGRARWRRVRCRAGRTLALRRVHLLVRGVRQVRVRQVLRRVPAGPAAAAYGCWAAPGAPSGCGPGRPRCRGRRPRSKLHLHRADERVALLAGVLVHGRAQLVAEGGLPLPEPVVVGAAELHDEGVRRDRAVAADDRRLVVALAPQRARDLDGLHLTAEGLRERAVHRTLDALLEAVEHSHGRPPLRHTVATSRPQDEQAGG